MANLATTYDVVEVQRCQELVRYCEVSRDQRRALCDNLRYAYERGTLEGPRAAVNEILPHIDRVASYLFAPDIIRLGGKLQRQYAQDWRGAAMAAREIVQQSWHDSGTDQVFVLLLEWALVYNSTVAKVMADPATGWRTGYIEPWDFGVPREDIPRLDSQDTMTHYYDLSIPEIERWVKNQPREDDLLDIARKHERKLPGQIRQGLVVSTIQGIYPGSTVLGGFPGQPDMPGDDGEPMVDEPTVPFVDLWERRVFKRKTPWMPKGEEYEDWLVTTMVADGSEIFARRRNPVLPWVRLSKTSVLEAEHPFVMVTPRPRPRYLWGRSEVAFLLGLQRWILEHYDAMKKGIGKQLNPAKFFSGIADYAEAGAALDSEGGSYSSAEPGAKMDQVRVQLGAEIFQFEQLLERKFADASGLPKSMSEPGQLPGGVRSEGHFSLAASIGSGRILRMARLIEDPLGQIATKGYHILQRQDDQKYEREDGPPFLLSQIPPGALAFGVNSHSASPIFAEQTKQDGYLLHRAKVIRGEDLIEMVNPPNKDELKAHAREIEKSQAERSEELLEIQRTKALKGQGGRVGRPPK